MVAEDNYLAQGAYACPGSRGLDFALRVGLPCIRRRRLTAYRLPYSQAITYALCWHGGPRCVSCEDAWRCLANHGEMLAPLWQAAGDFNRLCIYGASLSLDFFREPLHTSMAAYFFLVTVMHLLSGCDLICTIRILYSHPPGFLHCRCLRYGKHKASHPACWNVPITSKLQGGESDIQAAIQILVGPRSVGPPMYEDKLSSDLDK